MRRWSFDLICPKCGSAKMVPEWSGVVIQNAGDCAGYLETGFRARCTVCEYLEEVLPLDAPEEAAK